MSLHEVFTTCVKCKYRAPLCSGTSLVVFLIAAFVFAAPFLIAYRTQGLWLKEGWYREQPEVHFKYEYMFIAETDVLEQPLVCSSFSSLAEIDDIRCPVIKVREEDTNRDGLNDILYFELEAIVPGTESVEAISLMLIFEYKLYSYSQLEMECLGLVTEVWPGSSRSLEVSAELRLHQRQPLRASGRDVRYNMSVVKPTARSNPQFDLHHILNSYSTRDVSTRFENIYKTWKRGRAVGDTFQVKATITYPQDSILYTPDFWHVIKLAWVQYIAILVPFFIFGRKLKKFLLDAHIIRSVKELPWNKYK